MSESNWDSRRCNEKSGFLFDHACKQSPVTNCTRCDRPVCNDHFREDDSRQNVCITCAKKELKGLGKQQNVGKRRYGRHSRWHDHDPYFYGGYYYYGWGYYGDGYWGHGNYHQATSGDPVDFTEADSEGLYEGDASDFESDMSES